MKRLNLDHSLCVVFLNLSTINKEQVSEGKDFSKRQSSDTPLVSWLAVSNCSYCF